MNRITALGLTFYLYLHLAVLGQLANGPEGYNNFLDLIHNPIFIAGELLVVAGGIIHGFNGVRIVLTTFGVSVTSQKQLFYALMAIAVVVILFFGIYMFTA